MSGRSQAVYVRRGDEVPCLTRGVVVVVQQSVASCSMHHYSCAKKLKKNNKSFYNFLFLSFTQRSLEYVLCESQNRKRDILDTVDGGRMSPRDYYYMYDI